MDINDLQHIWEVPKYLPYIQPALTAETIREAEAKIGYKLPAAYLELLATQNGGYIRYIHPECEHDQIMGIGPYYPSITNFEWLKEYGSELDGLFPFDGDGHWNICLDYRINKNEPEITYIDTETINSEPIYERNVAKNFKEYLDQLVFDSQNEFVIETNATIEEVLRDISSAINCDFGPPDTYGSGYPVYSGRYNSCYFSVRANKVPAGFVRKDNDKYEELKGQMEIQSLRHHEVNEKFIFIMSSDEAQGEELVLCLTQKGFVINPLEKYINK